MGADMETEHEYLTIGEMADVLRVPKMWLYMRTRKDAIPCIRVGRHLRFEKKKVMEFLTNSENGKTN